MRDRTARWGWRRARHYAPRAGFALGSYRLGQTEVLERSFENAEGVDLFGGREGVNGEEITTGIVSNGERVAVAPVSQHELALVVSTPELVGFGHVC